MQIIIELKKIYLSVAELEHHRKVVWVRQKVQPPGIL